MTREELHKELSKVLYIEDFNLVDTIMASIIANSKMIGDPVWLTVIGPSSAGKSQLIRPFAKANDSLFLQVDDLSANTFISGNGQDFSLIFKIKKGGVGIISMDDLTVLFSKNSEDKTSILSQLRMIYDGRFIKGTGKSKDKSIRWEGYAGMIAGSTPAIYRHFGEVADMGERFVNYRMKPIDENKAVDFVDKKGKSASSTDNKIKLIYGKYLSSIMSNKTDISKVRIDKETLERIVIISKVCTRFRTPIVTDDRDHFVSEIPDTELPFRVMKQLKNLARAFATMQLFDTGSAKLAPEMRDAIEWVGYSLADDKRRVFFRAVLSCTASGVKATTNNISLVTGMHRTLVERVLNTLAAIGIVRKDEDGEADAHRAGVWVVTDQALAKVVVRIDPPEELNFEDYNNSEDNF